jgi:hypothetical protein
MSTATQSTTTSTSSRRLRRAGITAGAFSAVMATAALGASMAPSTGSTVATGARSASASTATFQGAAMSASDRAALAERSQRSSRSRQEAAEPEVVGKRYTTAPLNVRTKASADAKVITVLDPGTRVKITDKKKGDYRQIVHKGETRWVTAQYLSKSKPAPKPAGPSSAACATGSSVERGLTSNAIAVHRAVCNQFPSITSYGGVRGGGGAHGSGRALDIMVTGSTGDQVAAYVRANASKLGVSEVIWAQKIWTVQRSSEGWRHMPDRGSATANHYDHVHVTTY